MAEMVDVRDVAVAADGAGADGAVMQADGTQGDAAIVVVADAVAVGTPARRRAARGKAKAAVRKPAGRRGRRKVRRIVRWSQGREDLFLATLAQSSCVAEAVRASGLSDTNVYRRRAQSAEFRAKWVAALREGYLKLESEMLARALAGVEKPVFQGGKEVGRVTEYNDRVALALLTMHRATVMGAAPAGAGMPEEELRERVKRRLGEMNRRMGGAG